MTKKPIHHSAAEPEGLTAEQAASIRRIAGSFARDVPNDARMSGQYKATDTDRFAGEVVNAPNGRYRVSGSDWIVQIKNKRLQEVFRALPPAFGGKGVIDIANG